MVYMLSDLTQTCVENPEVIVPKGWFNRLWITPNETEVTSSNLPFPFHLCGHVKEKNKKS